MGVGELTERSRQELSKWIDRTWTAGSQPPSGASSPPPVAGRFFEGATAARTTYWLAPLDPTLRERTVERAEAICAGRFDLLGYRGLSFGDPIDWHLDPISGRRAPPVHWSQIDPLDRAALGDARLIWELNRHQWLVALGQAYRLTGRDRYAEVAAARIRGWMSDNAPGVGINWSSSLEIAFRLIAWFWAVALMRSSAAFSAPRFASLLRDWTAAHASHVARYLSHYHSPNTHLTGEALALCYAGVHFAGTRSGRTWAGSGAKILARESTRQILPDGVYFEQSTGYQRYTVEFYLHFLALSALNDIEVDSEVGVQVQRMLDFLLYVRSPGGRLPQIGDADGGVLVPLSDRAPDDTADLFSTAAVLFGRADYAWAAGSLAPETVWLLGGDAAEAFQALEPRPPDASPSRLFASGGYAVMAGGWAPDAHHLLFDAGPLGCPLSGAHGHADLLSIQCSAFGRPILVDPGTYLYTRHPGWRDRFRATAAHSTVLVDGLDQAAPSGPFAWKSRPSARLTGWSSGPREDVASADHDAYAPVTHRRTVMFAKPGHWVVTDELLGEGEHAFEVRFQFAPRDVRLEPGGWARARDGAGHAVLVRTTSSTTIVSRIAAGDDAPGGGWVSPAYGVRHPAPMLIASGTAHLPVRLVTVIVPTADASAPAPALPDESVRGG
jgi:hypothetical protein